MVEVVVAMTMLTVVLIGVIGVLTSTFGVAAGNNDRSRAVAVATREIESLRSTPWEQLVPAQDATPREVQVGGKTYEVQREVAEGASGKDATVVVRWEGTGGRVSELHQSTTIYPGGLVGATPTTVPSSLAGLLAAPTALVATLPTDADAGTTVDLAWTNPVPANPLGSTLVVEWSVNNFTGSSTRLTERLASTLNRVRVPGLSAGTTYSFRMAATSATGELSAWSPIATITTASSTSTACTYGSAAVSPSHVRRHATLLHRLASPVTVSINTSGSCVGLHVVYQPNDQAAPRSWPLAPAAGGVWSAALPEVAGEVWSVGVHELTIHDQLETKRATAYLTVCDHGATAC